MSDEQMVDIEGLSRAQVLAALFNASAPGGMGFLQAPSGPKVMTEEHAEGWVHERTSFDYLYGRPLKLNLMDDTEFDPRGFDRDNGGPGTAQRVIDQLRETGEVNPQASLETHEGLLHARAHQAVEFARTSTRQEGNIEVLGGSDVGSQLEEAVDHELER